MTGSARVIRGNALALPLEDASVDLVVTSPPYFGLRSYQDGGEHYAGQIGSEATPAEFVDALIAATAEMVRVLKPSGSIWVNLGDKYSGAQAQNFGGQSRAGASAKVWQQTNPKNTGIPNKSLMGIPWRYAIRCIDDLGLILRAEVIWAKPNGLPESVTDRVRRSHETWFHFVRNPRYFSAVDEIREPHVALGRNNGQQRSSEAFRVGTGDLHRGLSPENSFNPLGKLPGSVWSIPTQPLKAPPELGINHFAAFPMEWPRRIIQGWSPAGVCTVCGEGRRPVAGHTAEWTAFRKTHGMGNYAEHGEDARQGKRDTYAHGLSGATIAAFGPKVAIHGYACACPCELDHNHDGSEGACYNGPMTGTPTIPAVILDPFGGTGTTALVAKALGRDGISVDMSADYCRLATWRTNDPGQMAAALQVEKPEPVHPDQLDLFNGAA